MALYEMEYKKKDFIDKLGKVLDAGNSLPDLSEEDLSDDILDTYFVKFKCLQKIKEAFDKIDVSEKDDPEFSYIKSILDNEEEREKNLITLARLAFEYLSDNSEMIGRSKKKQQYYLAYALLKALDEKKAIEYQRQLKCDAYISRILELDISDKLFWDAFIKEFEIIDFDDIEALLGEEKTSDDSPEDWEVISVNEDVSEEALEEAENALAEAEKELEEDKAALADAEDKAPQKALEASSTAPENVAEAVGNTGTAGNTEAAEDKDAEEAKTALLSKLYKKLTSKEADSCFYNNREAYNQMLQSVKHLCDYAALSKESGEGINPTMLKQFYEKISSSALRYIENTPCAPETKADAAGLEAAVGVLAVVNNEEAKKQIERINKGRKYMAETLGLDISAIDEQAVLKLKKPADSSFVKEEMSAGRKKLIIANRLERIQNALSEGKANCSPCVLVARYFVLRTLYDQIGSSAGKHEKNGANVEASNSDILEAQKHLVSTKAFAKVYKKYLEMQKGGAGISLNAKDMYEDFVKELKNEKKLEKEKNKNKSKKAIEKNGPEVPNIFK